MLTAKALIEGNKWLLTLNLADANVTPYAPVPLKSTK